MGTVTLPNTSKSTSDTNLFAHVKDNDQAIIDQLNGNVEAANLASNAVTTAKITDANVTTDKLAASAVTTAKITDANVTDAKLASPNNSVYRTISQTPVSYFGTAPTGTYFFLATSGGAAATGTSTGTGGTAPQGLIYFDGPDYTVSGLTQKLRIRQQVIVGSTSPSTVTLNCGLYPVTVSSGNWTLGTVISSSATSTSGLATNTISSFTSASGDFTIPLGGAYALGVVVGSITVPAGIHVAAQLQTRNV